MSEPRSGGVPGVDGDIDLLLEHLDALDELAADPDLEPESPEVYDFSIRWGTMLAGRLPRLAHYHSRGELGDDGERRYDELRARLRDAEPAIERLELATVRIPLDQP